MGTKNYNADIAHCCGQNCLRNKIYKTLPKFLEAIKDLKYYDGSNPDHTIFIKSKR